jgi:hypothetical protein
MNLPNWVHETIRKFVAPPTGKVVIELECYQSGVTKMEIGGVTRTKPSDECETKEDAVIHQIIRRR